MGDFPCHLHPAEKNTRLPGSNSTSFCRKLAVLSCFHRSFVDGLDGNYPFELEDVSTCILGFNKNMLENIWIIILVDNIGYFDVQQ